MRITVLQKRPHVKRYLYYGIILFAVGGACLQIEALPTYQAAAQEQKKGDEQSATAIQSPKGGTETAVSNQNQEAAGDKIRKSEWAQIFISAFVGLVILWQAWIYNEQRKATRIAERAYIGIKDAAVVDFQAGKIPGVEVVFLNGGRTPLWNFYSPAELVVNIKPPSGPLPKVPKGEAGAFLPAGVTGRVRYEFGNRPITQVMINEIVTGKTKLFLRGEAWFEDCWGDLRSFPFHLIFLPESGYFKDYKEYAQILDAEYFNIPNPRANPQK
jgi:hypothetical protein